LGKVRVEVSLESRGGLLDRAQYHLTRLAEIYFFKAVAFDTLDVTSGVELAKRIGKAIATDLGARDHDGMGDSVEYELTLLSGRWES
jgi:hypothetical protein